MREKLSFAISVFGSPQRSVTAESIPYCLRYLAATKQSPALLPLPHKKIISNI